MKPRKPRKKGVAKIYWPNCSVCQYMKDNPAFRYRVMQSTYFNPQGSENLMEVVHSFGDPFKSGVIYAHMKRHQAKDLVRAATKFDSKGNLLVDNRFKTTVEVVERVNSESTTNHELGLDSFIEEGRNKLARGDLSITATTYLQAIKIKADIEKGTKDRRVDMLKGLFKGAAPKKEV